MYAAYVSSRWPSLCIVQVKGKVALVKSVANGDVSVGEHVGTNLADKVWALLSEPEAPPRPALSRRLAFV